MDCRAYVTKMLWRLKGQCSYVALSHHSRSERVPLKLCSIQAVQLYEGTLKLTNACKELSTVSGLAVSIWHLLFNIYSYLWLSLSDLFLCSWNIFNCRLLKLILLAWLLNLGSRITGLVMRMALGFPFLSSQSACKQWYIFVRWLVKIKGAVHNYETFFFLCEILTSLPRDWTNHLDLISTELQAAEHFAFIILIMWWWL